MNSNAITATPLVEAELEEIVEVFSEAQESQGPEDAALLILEELLIEEVSIDGMCGVY